MTADSVATSVPLSCLLDEFCSRDGVAKSTLRRDRWSAGVITDHFGADRDARTITRAEVLEFKSLLGDVYGGSTPRAILYCLVRPLERAHLDGRLPRCVTVGMLLSTTNGGSR
jgi:hypothetical protein